MADISSVASSTAAFFSQQTAALTKAAGSATTSFASTLSSVQNTIVRPKTGFTAGPTYEAGTLTGQTKAALSNTFSATKSALNIKP
jgi:uncharacterized membrane protein YfcA